MSQLPEDWKIQSIKALKLDISDGNYSSKYPKQSDFIESGIPFIRANNIKNMTVISEDMRFISESQHSELKKGHLKKNDILITTRGNIGQVALVPDHFIGANINAQVVRIGVSESIFFKYLAYILTYKETQKNIKSLETGTALKQLPVKKLDLLKIPLPPLEEQKKIADILNTVDQKIAFVEDNISQTQELKKGLMQKLLTQGIGHTEFKDSEIGRIPESWEVTKLSNMIEDKSITSHLDGNHGGLYPKQSEFVDSGVPYLSANMIHDSTVDFSASKYLTEERASLFRKGVAKDNDILFAHNATVGPVALLKTDLAYVILSTTLTYYRCDLSKLSNLYILYYMQSPKFVNQYERLMKQSTRNQIPITQQRNLYFILPPLEEQKQIAEILSTVDQKLEVLKDKKGFLQELKKGLMQKLLTGEVRV